MLQPRQERGEAVLRVVRYLKKNPGKGILLRSNSTLNLTGWCDSDWMSCPLKRRSLTCKLVSLGFLMCLGKTRNNKLFLVLPRRSNISSWQQLHVN